MTYSRLWAHDGNTSLKRLLPFGKRMAADTRVFEDSDYFLSRSFVDQYAHEVKRPPESSRRREVRTTCEDSASESGSGSDTEDEDSATERDTGGDPTDGAVDAAEKGVDDCVKNWKAAASDEKKRSWAIFDENGIYASACRHGLILWICDMVRSGEL